MHAILPKVMNGAAWWSNWTFSGSGLEPCGKNSSSRILGYAKHATFMPMKRLNVDLRMKGDEQIGPAVLHLLIHCLVNHLVGQLESD